MTARLFAFTCGHLTIPWSFMLEGREGHVAVPVPAYLVVHPKGMLVFDSGLHVDTQSDPVAHVGEGLARYHGFDVHPGEEIAARLAAIDVDPATVGLVVNSHLHFDHAGGNAQLPEADVLVQRREWEAAHRDGAERRGYVTTEYDTGQRVRLVDGEHDVFGDGSVVCVPTYGHTPGHHSLRVRTAAGEFVLCGDACYLRESLERLHLPGVIADRDAALRSFQVLRDLQARGARIMFGHDAEFWRDVTQAPIALG